MQGGLTVRDKACPFCASKASRQGKHPLRRGWATGADSGAKFGEKSFGFLPDLFRYERWGQDVPEVPRPKKRRALHTEMPLGVANQRFTFSQELA